MKNTKRLRINVLNHVRSNLGTKKKCPYKTGVILKEVQFIWNFLWQDKKRVTF